MPQQSNRDWCKLRPHEKLGGPDDPYQASLTQKMMESERHAKMGEKARIRYYTIQEVDKILKKIKDPRDKAMFTVAYYRGMRVSEIAALQVSDWDPARKRLAVFRSKDGYDGEYVASPDETQALTAWVTVRGRDPGPLFPSERLVGGKWKALSRSQMFRLFRRYVEMAGFPADKRAHPHTLRHSIASHLTERGYTIQQVRDWLGHKSIRSTALYAHVTNAGRDEVSSKFYKQRADETKPPKVKWDRKSRYGKPKGQPKLRSVIDHAKFWETREV